MRISDWSSDVCSSDLSITLEPGGQFELSGAPLETIHQTCIEVNTHLKQIREIGKEIGIAMMGMGFQPKWHRDEIPVMPKGRYGFMRSYMHKKGKLKSEQSREGKECVNTGNTRGWRDNKKKTTTQP